MDLLSEIKKSGKKGKELNSFLAQLIIDKKPSVDDFSKALSCGNDAERGTCLEALEFATLKNPEIAEPFLALIISSLKDKAPRVKWEAARTIGNIAPKYPLEAVKAVDNLLLNTSDKGMVIRWSAAFALGGILKATKDKVLLKKIEEIVKKEKSSGVKNVYLKVIKLS